MTTTTNGTPAVESGSLQDDRDPMLGDVTNWARDLYVAMLNTIDERDLADNARALWDAGGTILGKQFEAGEEVSESETRLGYTLVLSALFTSAGAMECAVGRIIAQFVKQDPAVRMLNGALITEDQINAKEEQHEAFVVRALADDTVRNRLYGELVKEATRDACGMVFKMVDEADRDRKAGDRPSPSA